MKQFKVFKHPAGDMQLIKQGWCWPAFFFSVIWAMVSKMWVLGIGSLIGFLVLGAIVDLLVPQIDMRRNADGFINFIALAVSIYFGSNGNQLREKNLLSRGFELNDTVAATNKDGAIALFLKNSSAAVVPASSSLTGEVKDENLEAPKATAGLSYLTGDGVGYGLGKYLGTEFTKNLKNRRVVIFASILISLGLVLAIITATVLFTKPAGKFDAAFWEPADVTGQFSLGVMYLNGEGVPQDYSKAVQWFRKAADQGDAGAQTNLGVMYNQGKGVPQDYAQAMQWYRKAADQGNAWAQSNLGGMYDEGQGVPQDYAKSVQWYILAKASGLKEVEQDLALAESKATPAQIAEAQKLAREWWTAHHPGQ